MCNKAILGVFLRNNCTVKLKNFHYCSQIVGLHNYVFKKNNGIPNLMKYKKITLERPNVYKTKMLSGISAFNGNSSLQNLQLSCSHHYCTDSSGKRPLPKLMEFPEVTWPSFFKSIRNWILSQFIIMRYFDNEFNLPDFVVGSKKVRYGLFIIK